MTQKSELEVIIAEQFTIALKLGASIEEALDYEDIRPFVLELVERLMEDYKELVEFRRIKREWDVASKKLDEILKTPIE